MLSKLLRVLLRPLIETDSKGSEMISGIVGSYADVLWARHVTM